MTFGKESIPSAVCSVVGRVLGDTYYNHTRLNALFYEAGAPGDPPHGNCVGKCTSWLKRCNADPAIDALAVLGEVLVDFMDAWPTDDDPSYRESKAQIQRKLAEYGLRYYQGRVIGSASPTAKDLQSTIQSRDLAALRVEFDRSLRFIESDPAASVTAACAIFEAFCNIYIEEEGLEPPTKIGAQSLWRVVRDHIGARPTPEMDKRMKQILSGLASVIEGVSSMRNSTSSAHGRRQVYPVEPRHARLAVNASHALVLFLMEVWDHRKDGFGSEDAEGQV